MSFKKEVDLKEWHKIGDHLCAIFRICSCQRKLKTIVDNLYSIYTKLETFQNDRVPLDFTGAEWLLVAMIDKNTEAITHGTNCEYPILNKDNELWKWVIEVKNNPNLEDN